MNIALDITPLQEHSLHAVRGSGYYIRYLRDAFEKYQDKHTFSFFTNKDSIPSADISHFPYFEPFFLTLPMRKKNPTVVTIHDLIPIKFAEHFPSGLKGNIKWQMQRASLRNCKAIITDSNASKIDIVEFAGIPENKVHVINLAAGEIYKKNEVSSIQHQTLQQKYGLPDRFILYVGDVTWNKNLPRLLQAVKLTNIPLIMVGKALAKKEVDATNQWNNDLVTIQRMAEGEKNIVRLGYVPNEELVFLYNLAEVFIMPSLYEGFGLPILEAMSSGCPVITTKEGSLPEVAGNAAHFVDAYSIESIAEGIQEVFSNTVLRKKMSALGVQQAASFSWQKTAKQTIAVYENC